MPRAPSARTIIAALAVALIAAALAPGAGASTSGDDAEGEVTVMETEGEPPRNLTLEITLVDNRTGEPVPDVLVELANRWEGGASDRWSLVSDGNGTVAVDASAGPVRFHVDDPGWKRVTGGLRLDGNLSFELPLRPVETELATLEGVVADRNGTPLADASLEVDPARECDDRRCHVERDARPAEDATLHPGGPNGTKVSVHWQARDDRTKHVGADEEGAYTVQLPAGDYRLEAEAPGHVPETIEVNLAENESVERDLALQAVPPSSATLQGVVREAGTGDPVAGALVVVENPKWGHQERIWTDEDGAYAVDAKPGHALVAVRAGPGSGKVCTMGGSDEGAGGASTQVVDRECESRPSPDQAYLPTHRGISLEADATRNLSVDLEEEPEPSARIEGWVLADGTDDPVPNATVRIQGQTQPERGVAVADGNGSFAAAVPEGRYTVRVEAPGHLPNVTDVRVDEGETAQVVLHVPEGEVLVDDRCCYRTHPTPERDHDETRGTHHAGGSGDGTAAGGTDGGEAGTQSATLQAGPGGLGPYEQASDGSDRPGEEPEPDSEIPGPGAGVLGALTGAAVLGRPLRRR